MKRVFDRVKYKISGKRFSPERNTFKRNERKIINEEKDKNNWIKLAGVTRATSGVLIAFINVLDVGREC